MVRQITGELADLAETAASEAAAVVRNALRAIARAGEVASGRLRRTVADLETTLARTAKVVAQTHTRLAGDTPDRASRLVSLDDPDAARSPGAGSPTGRVRLQGPGGRQRRRHDPRSQRRGRQPAGRTPAPARYRTPRRTGKPSQAVTADRAYGDASVEDDLSGLGAVRHLE